MRGQDYCVAHIQHEQDDETPSVPPQVQQAAAQLYELTQAARTRPTEDAEVIEGEIRNLQVLRSIVAAWIAEKAATGWQGGKPTQFLNAWSNSVRQVAQLLRVRRELGHDEGGADLLDAAYAAIEACPGVAAITGDATGAHADTQEPGISSDQAKGR